MIILLFFWFSTLGLQLALPKEVSMMMMAKKSFRSLMMRMRTLLDAFIIR